MKPIIGITGEARHAPEDLRTQGKIELGWNYADEVAKAGGVPVVIPPMADMAELAPMLDGWLITGGLDIDASRFGEENHPKVEKQDPARYEAEESLMRFADPRMPVLGICYGCQFLNVVRGGKLIQHLPDVLGHESHSGGTLQRYSIDQGSLLSGAAGTTEVEGKSYHHQAVGELGSGLKVVARHEDGTVEGVEDDSGRWLVGVQWHPERTPEDPATQSLFRRFVAEALRFKEAKSQRNVG